MFEARLAERLRGLAVGLPGDRLTKLTEYFELLRRWSLKVNLTGFDLEDPTDEAIDRLFVEPVIASRYLSGTSALVDVGSGAGSPAIPVTLMLDDVELTMLEPRLKKSTFLREAVRSLGIRGAVLTSRVEDAARDHGLLERFDSATIRAVRLDGTVLRSVADLLRSGGQLFLFSGQSSVLDQATMPSTLTHSRTFPLIRAQGSELVVLRKTAP
jgi:16S rRNA (guanine527-N7)-methyltransferase